MADEGQPLTLQQRIAALNASHIRTPADAAPGRPKPQTVPQHKPVVLGRQKSANGLIWQTNGAVEEPPTLDSLSSSRVTASARQQPDRQRPPPPPLPKRHSSHTSPALPPRRSTDQNVRQGSEESVLSLVSGSQGSQLTTARSRESPSARIKAPAWGGSELPTLPQRNGTSTARTISADRSKYHNRVPSTQEFEGEEEEEAPRPTLPPRLPSRRQTDHASDLSSHSLPSRNVPPVPSAASLDKVKRSALSFGLNKPGPPPLPPGRPDSNREPVEPVSMPTGPPAIPLASRPDISAIQATKPRTTSATTGYQPPSSTESTSCMVCRDFSAPDHNATLFPRHTVSSLQTLAQSLTTPFHSPTDKARAIFTWLHLNIAYDTESFFAGNVQRSTPQSTLQSGLAVCEGYAALFTTIASHAGLSSIVITGHGKGYGYTPLSPSTPIPPFSSGHAWNAVQIDDGEWKLIDSCWGAGHVQGKGKPYVRRFEPKYFTMSNAEFGTKHFPQPDSIRDLFFLPHSFVPPDWAEYILINPDSWPDNLDPLTIFSNAGPDYGVGSRTVAPRAKSINVHPHHPSQNIEFSFALHCPHWTLESHTRKGPPPVFILATHGIDGREKDYVPLTHRPGPSGGGGDSWHLSIPSFYLGAPGQTLTLFAVSSFGGREDARGLSVQEFLAGRGRVAMGFCGVAAWELI